MPDQTYAERHPLMKCGHAAQGHDGNGKPVCIICLGITPGAAEVDDAPPSFAGRTAFCTYGKHAEKPSASTLAFFKHHPDREHDEYYCGCYGWD